MGVEGVRKGKLEDDRGAGAVGVEGAEMCR